MGKTLIIAVCISISWWIFTAAVGIADERIWNSFFLQYLWEFVLGMCMAEYLASGNDIRISCSVLVIQTVVGIGLGGFMAVHGGNFRVFNDVLVFVGYASLAVLIYIVCGKRLRSVTGKISRVSYEWYLVHILVFDTMVFLFPLTTSLGQAVRGVLHSQSVLL